MTSQKENAENIDLLASSFPLRCESNYSLGNVVSNHLMLPGLRGFWPFSSIDDAAAVHDLSGQGRNLTYAVGYSLGVLGLLPYAGFAGGGYLLRADEAGLDITGSCTWGGWFYATGVAGTQGLIGKWGAPGVSGAYLLYLSGATPTVIIEDGAGAFTSHPGPAITATTWNFIAGRFTSASELAIFVNGTWARLAAGIPAALRNNAIDFRIGAYGNPAANQLTGRAALCWLCAGAASDAVVNNLYQQARPLFGV